MSSFFLLCALPPEAVAAKAGLMLHERSQQGSAAGRASGSVGHVRIIGMGPERARKASARLASSVPDGVPVVVLGVGGALVGGYEPGDLIVADAVGFADVRPGSDELQVTTVPEALDGRSEALSESLATALRERFGSTRRAPVLTAGRTARGRERAKLGESGAVICDTESGILMRLAERRPFAVVRSVVDGPDRELLSLQTITGGIRGLKRLSDAARIIAGVLERDSAGVLERDSAGNPAQPIFPTPN